MIDALIITGWVVAFILLVILLVNIISYPYNQPSYNVFRFLRMLGVQLNVPWYYHAKPGMYFNKGSNNGMYISNILSKNSSQGHYIIFKLKAMSGSGAVWDACAAEINLVNLATHDITPITKVDILKLNANRGLTALKTLNKDYKNTFRIVDGKVV